MLKIGDFSTLSKISIYMLRHYDKLGLLVPAYIDNFTGYRYYEENQLTIANRIQSLKSMGLGLNAIKEVLNQYQDSNSLANYFRIEAESRREQVEIMLKQIKQLETTVLALQSSENILRYSIEVKEIPKRTVISTRGKIETYAHEGDLWARLADTKKAQNISSMPLSYDMAIFHDEGFIENGIDVEVQSTVSRKGTDTADVKYRDVPAYLAAVLTYEGEYDKIVEISQFIANWVLDNGYEFCGPHFNIYHVSPSTEDNPAKMVTEVGFPIKKKEKIK